MFIINQTLNADKIPEGKLDELFQQHVAWFTRHFEAGDFLLVGPYTDQKMAGIMICGAKTRDDVERIISEDVFYADGLANYEIRSFTAKQIAKNFAAYTDK